MQCLALECLEQIKQGAWIGSPPGRDPYSSILAAKKNLQLQIQKAQDDSKATGLKTSPADHLLSGWIHPSTSALRQAVLHGLPVEGQAGRQVTRSPASLFVLEDALSRHGLHRQSPSQPLSPVDERVQELLRGDQFRDSTYKGLGILHTRKDGGSDHVLARHRFDFAPREELEAHLQHIMRSPGLVGLSPDMLTKTDDVAKQVRDKMRSFSPEIQKRVFNTPEGLHPDDRVLRA